MFTFAAPIGRKGIVLRKVRKEVLGEDLKGSELRKKKKKLLEITKTFLPLQSQNEGCLKEQKGEPGEPVSN
jgi:hypothetical protein